MIGTLALATWLVWWLPLDTSTMVGDGFWLGQFGGASTRSAWFLEMLVLPTLGLVLAVALSDWCLLALWKLWWRLRWVWLALTVAQMMLLMAPWLVDAWSEASRDGLDAGSLVAPVDPGVWLAALLESALPTYALMLAAGWAAWWVRGRPLGVVLLGALAPLMGLARLPGGRWIASASLAMGLRVLIVLDELTRLGPPSLNTDTGRSIDAFVSSSRRKRRRSPWRRLVAAWRWGLEGRNFEGRAVDASPRAQRLFALLIEVTAFDTARQTAPSRGGGPSRQRFEHSLLLAWTTLRRTNVSTLGRQHPLDRRNMDDGCPVWAWARSVRSGPSPSNRAPAGILETESDVGAFRLTAHVRNPESPESSADADAQGLVGLRGGLTVYGQTGATDPCLERSRALWRLAGVVVLLLTFALAFALRSTRALG